MASARGGVWIQASLREDLTREELTAGGGAYLGLGVESTWEVREGWSLLGGDQVPLGVATRSVGREEKRRCLSSEGKKQKSKVRYVARVATGEGPGLQDFRDPDLAVSGLA